MVVYFVSIFVVGTFGFDFGGFIIFWCVLECMDYRTVEVDLASESTDVSAVREQIKGCLSEPERRSIFDSLRLLFVEDELGEELLDEVVDSLPEWFFSGPEDMGVRDAVLSMHEEVNAVQNMSPEVAGVLERTLFYLYQYEGCEESVSDEEMNQVQELAIENGYSLSGIMPIR